MVDRYLIETSAVDGYLIEDGSGVLILEVAADPQLVTPTTASLTLSTFAPTVSTPRRVTPGVASLILTTFAPTVTAGAGLVITPTPASLALTAFAPNVIATDHKRVTPTTASLVLTGFAPTVTGSAGGPPPPSQIGTPIGTSHGEPVTVSFG